LYTNIFPKTDTNPDYPEAAALNTIIRTKWGEYYILHSAGKTALATQKYVQIQEATVVLMVSCEGACGDDPIKLAETGFAVNKLTKTKEPQTNIPKDLHSMTQSHGNFKIEYTCDEFMHFCKGRTRKLGASDSDWVEKESSETETMLFTGYPHAQDTEVQTCACGTAGQSEWSESKIVLVD
jgi:hypothetical protein